MADSNEVVKERFVTHIGRVTINNYGAVIFEPNAISKNIYDELTIRQLHREVQDAIKEMKAEGVYRR